jgi:ATP-dependent Clp protease ATP-binding subunit ClpC
MNSERFTLRSRKVLTLAQQEAQRLQSNGIGTQHLLLGLLQEGQGIAAHVLEQLGVDLKKTGADIEMLTAQETPTTAGSMTVEAKHVMVLAEEEACHFNHPQIGTEHFLLGLLREEKGTAAPVLKSLGIELDQTRTLILQMVDRERQRRHPDSTN